MSKVKTCGLYRLRKVNGKHTQLLGSVKDFCTFAQGSGILTKKDDTNLHLSDLNIESCKIQHDRLVMEVHCLIYNEKKVAYDSYTGTIELELGWQNA